MGYGYVGLGRAAIDSQSISDYVEAGFERALEEALTPDPMTGEMVFDEQKIDKILEEERKYLQSPPDPLQLVARDLTDPGERQQYTTRIAPNNSDGGEFEISNDTGGGSVFPLLAFGLLAYLGSRQ